MLELSFLSAEEKKKKGGREEGQDKNTYKTHKNNK